ncbi:MAG TPA: MBOAT family protein, partial [Polyangiaceae bacterium]|nr:MBOAT family protein [Polyangiaceae bacterium]
VFLFYFLPLVLVSYYALPFKARTLLIAVASYVFYGWANPIWALIMFVGSSVDYVAGRLLLKFSGLRDDGELPPIITPDVPRTPRMKVLLALSIATNLGVLAVFKYTGFVAENVNALAQLFGAREALVPVIHLVLPVGISFYTFKAMSYVIDVYRGEARPMRRFTDYMCFEAFFPDLVAGPIIRYAALEEQMRVRQHTLDKFARGVAFFAFGMAKKILIANPMGNIADTAFDAGTLHAIDAWFGLVAYAFQIYFDFSGYSDMAIGLALMLGFVLIQNFDSPYKSESITEFWRRWHISLSTWLRDYLYVPLGGNRRGPWRTYVNLMTVMLVGGLWHGASWNFVLWGGIHGLMLAFERAQGKASAYHRLPGPLRVGVTFSIVCLAWVFFRAETLTGALAYFRSLFGVSSAGEAAHAVAGALYTPYHVAVFSVAALVVWRAPNTWEFTTRLTPLRAVYGVAMLGMAVLVMWTQTVNPFLYFQF